MLMVEQAIGDQFYLEIKVRSLLTFIHISAISLTFCTPQS